MCSSDLVTKTTRSAGKVVISYQCLERGSCIEKLTEDTVGPDLADIFGSRDRHGEGGAVAGDSLDETRRITCTSQYKQGKWSIGCWAFVGDSTLSLALVGGSPSYLEFSSHWYKVR